MPGVNAVQGEGVRCIFVEGGVYYVYNRLGRGERVFDREDERFRADINELDRGLAE